MTLVLVIGSGAREFIIIRKLLDDTKKINERVEIICIKTQENTSIDEMCMKDYITIEGSSSICRLNDVTNRYCGEFLADENDAESNLQICGKFENKT